MKSVLIAGDVHAPWHCEKTLRKVFEINKKLKPDYIIQIGDLYDFYSFSKFPRLFHITPQDEIIQARESAEWMWENFKKGNPGAKCVQLAGNHFWRPYKRLIESKPELAVFYNDKEILKFKGVETIYDDRDALEIDGVLYIHGFLSTLGQHCLHFNKSCVTGHSHRGGVLHLRSHGAGSAQLFELNAGFLGCDDAMPFRYTSTKFSKWTRGCGLIDEFGPRFIPL